MTGGGEHTGVNKEDGANPPPVDEQARGGWANETRRVERRGVQSDSVRHFVKRNEFADEGLTRGGIHRGDRSRDECQDVLMPQLPRSRQDNETHDERDNADASLRAL